ncbi:mitochondrial enolase superfamily member 1 [Diachasma alloeum]|uniref:mitochondrial enolase superfamily member 1 n=1 Tax=Diachasma alloeum TaxID=454923 RepID=UPI00073833E8|nr:mitochondrial enolase superfamily member 1 [Diachasma alloeum]
MVSGRVIETWVKDIRFPTSLNADGSDAMHTDPDYSCAYVMIKLENDLEGYGLTFTLGKGTEIVVSGCQAILRMLMKQNVDEIFNNFAEFWRKITNESQLRWVSPKEFGTAADESKFVFLKARKETRQNQNRRNSTRRTKF